MSSIVIAAVVLGLGIVLNWAWQFVYWAWLRPRKIEKLFRQQGLKGNSYQFLVGDSKETSDMYEKAYSKPIGFNDDITPRVMPNILHNVQKYGSYSFSWSGPRPRLFIMDTKAARGVLSKHRTYPKTFKIANHMVKLLFSGIACLDGDEWAQFRGKLNPVFSVDKLKPMVPAFQLCTEGTLSKWREIVSKEGGSCVVDVRQYLDTFTSEVLSQLMFTSPYTADIKQTFLELAELSELVKLPSKILTMPGEKYLPTRNNRRGKEIDSHARAVFTSMIRERLHTDKRAPSGNQDLLDVLMEDLYDGKITREKDRRKIIEDVIENCKLFFFAGFETSSNLLSWTLIMLSFHQDWQARARDEVFQVLGDKKDITNDDLSKLKTVTMIVNEMLRLYPPVMEITRLAGEDTKIYKRIHRPRRHAHDFPGADVSSEQGDMGGRCRGVQPGKVLRGSDESDKGRVRLHAVRVGPTHLHRHELCRVGDENVPRDAFARIQNRVLADLYARACRGNHCSSSARRSRRAEDTVNPFASIRSSSLSNMYCSSLYSRAIFSAFLCV